MLLRLAKTKQFIYLLSYCTSMPMLSKLLGLVGKGVSHTNRGLGNVPASAFTLYRVMEEPGRLTVLVAVKQ